MIIMTITRKLAAREALRGGALQQGIPPTLKAHNVIQFYMYPVFCMYFKYICNYVDILKYICLQPYNKVLPPTHKAHNVIQFFVFLIMWLNVFYGIWWAFQVFMHHVFCEKKNSSRTRHRLVHSKQAPKYYMKQCYIFTMYFV